MTDLDGPIVILIESFLDVAEILVFTLVVPILQSLVPGSANSLWSVSQYPLIMLGIIALAVYIIAVKKK